MTAKSRGKKIRRIVTTAELSERLRLSPGYISRLVSRGMPVHATEAPAGRRGRPRSLFDFDAVREWLAFNVQLTPLQAAAIAGSGVDANERPPPPIACTAEDEIDLDKLLEAVNIDQSEIDKMLEELDASLRKDLAALAEWAEG